MLSSKRPGLGIETSKKPPDIPPMAQLSAFRLLNRRYDAEDSRFKVIQIQRVRNHGMEYVMN